MMNRLQRFMYGRNGNDSLGIFCFILYIVLWGVNLPLRSNIIWGFECAIILIWAFRAFSRNIYKRQQENQVFLRITAPVRSFFHLMKRRFTEKGYRFYRCPSCKQTIRVPKGKGKIAIRCPKCHDEFIKRT